MVFVKKPRYACLAAITFAFLIMVFRSFQDTGMKDAGLYCPTGQKRNKTFSRSYQPLFLEVMA